MSKKQIRSKDSRVSNKSSIPFNFDYMIRNIGQHTVGVDTNVVQPSLKSPKSNNLLIAEMLPEQLLLESLNKSATKVPNTFLNIKDIKEKSLENLFLSSNGSDMQTTTLDQTGLTTTFKE